MMNPQADWRTPVMPNQLRSPRRDGSSAWQSDYTLPDQFHLRQNKILRLEFDATFESYGLSQVSVPANGGNEAAFLQITGAMGEAVHLPDDVKLSTEVSRMNFYPDGNIDRGEIMVCREKRCFTLSTKQQRGIVKVFEYSTEN